MIDKTYIDTEMHIVKLFTDSQDCKKKIIKHGKVEEARKTGTQYQMITEEDEKIILENLDKLFNIYGQINNEVLSLQAEVATVKNQFKKSLQEVE